MKYLLKAYKVFSFKIIKFKKKLEGRTSVMIIDS